MRRFAVMLPLLIAITGCNEPATKPAPDKVAEIERVNKGVVIPPKPQPILYPDIEANELTGPACAFAAEGGGLAPILLAMDGKAVMKLNGEIAEFAPDKGGQKGPSVAWNTYDGRTYSIRLELGDPFNGATSGKRYQASIALRDGTDRTVYRASGYAQCPN